MSHPEKDGLMDCLFSRQDAKLVNIKFWRGNNTIISREEVRRAVCAAVESRDTLPISTEPTRSLKPKVNVRKLVASM